MIIPSFLRQFTVPYFIDDAGLRNRTWNSLVIIPWQIGDPHINGICPNRVFLLGLTAVNHLFSHAFVLIFGSLGFRV